MTLLIILLMLAINALLAAYEMALASISRTKIAVLFQENHAGAQAALFMKDTEIDFISDDTGNCTC